MLTLKLPDGATREAPEGALPRDIVASIGPRLLRDAIAVQVDGEIIDLNTPLRKGGDFRVLTEKDPRSLAVLRHSGAHILATAVRRLRPDAQIGFGPAIEDGFYYDFGVTDPFTTDDLALFGAEVLKVVAERLPFTRDGSSRTAALARPGGGTRAYFVASPGCAGGAGEGDLGARPRVVPGLRPGLPSEYCERAPVRDRRPPGELPREHVFGDGRGGGGLWSQADEL